MEEIYLRLPCEDDKAASEEFVAEFMFDLKDKSAGIAGGSDINKMPFEEWLEQAHNWNSRRNVPKDRVPSSNFFIVRKADEKVLGVLNVRHTIEHPYLKKWGGHIGYSIRPTERRRGYASAALKAAVDIIARGELAAELDGGRLLITCDQSNAASEATIKKCGGVFENLLANEEGKVLKRYWIKVK